MRKPMTLPPPPAEMLNGASLFLDLDGTLVEFAESPAGISVCDQLRALLLDLHDRLDGRVAVISGRGLDDLAEHLELPDFPIAGSHGAERRLAGGGIETCAPSSEVSQAIAEAAEFSADHQLIVEPKPMGVAVHFRHRPAMEQAVDAFAAATAARHGLAVQKGAMVRELRAPGRNKGDVVRLYMSEPPFDAGRPVMVGDDVTDEDAFAVVNRLGGTSILVGGARDTQAQYALPDVAAVRQWLGAR